MSHGHGPEALERAIVLTFDNLGEASSLERGTWNPHTPLGEDPSVTVALPRLLDALDHSRLAATFFVEAVNCELNPEALAEIACSGHELGAHGWQHEEWASSMPPMSARCSRGPRAPSPRPAWMSMGFVLPAALSPRARPHSYANMALTGARRRERDRRRSAMGWRGCRSSGSSLTPTT